MNVCSKSAEVFIAALMAIALPVVVPAQDRDNAAANRAGNSEIDEVGVPSFSVQ